MSDLNPLRALTYEENQDGPLFQLLLSLRLEGQKKPENLPGSCSWGEGRGRGRGVGNELMQETDPTVHQAH